jgi:hypothetical protein
VTDLLARQWGGTMDRSAFPIRIAGRLLGVVSVVVLVALVLTGPAAALTGLYQETTPEPTPRDTATPSPYFELDPTQGVAGDPTPVVASGASWTPGGAVQLFWDDESVFLASGTVSAGGGFQIGFQTPTDPAHAQPGTHTVIAKQGGFAATATFELIVPSPTPPPPVPSLALTPNVGVAGNATRVTATGSRWMPGQVVTFYWDGLGGRQLGQTTAQADMSVTFVFQTPTSGALASVGAHTVLATAPNGQQAQATFTLEEPTVTPTGSPSPTPSTTPTPSPSPTLRPITPMVTITPIPPTQGPVRTSVPAPTRTHTPIPGTATSTPTPSITPTPSNTPTVTNTPGPGTPSVTPQPTFSPTPTPTPLGETPETGAGWGPVFLWGFVLAGLVVVFRVLRVRSVRDQS